MIYGVSDLHLDATKKKDMCVFGRAWENYEEKIFQKWAKTVHEQDTVLIPGDISWAMTLASADRDLARLDGLPGRKILLRGNHDYWWQSLKRNEQAGYRSFSFLQNNAFVVENTRIVGTRGWASPDSAEFKEADRKVYLREVIRLNLSFDCQTESYARTVCMLHYPPFLKDGTLNEIGQTVRDRGADVCVYGHLHASGLQWVREGLIEGVQFHCLSGDYIDFQPVEI